MEKVFKMKEVKKFEVTSFYEMNFGSNPKNLIEGYIYDKYRYLYCILNHEIHYTKDGKMTIHTVKVVEDKYNGKTINLYFKYEFNGIITVMDIEEEYWR